MRRTILALILGCAAPAHADTLIVAAMLDAAPALTAAEPAPLFTPPVLKGMAFVGAAVVAFTSIVQGPEDVQIVCPGGCGGPYPLPIHYGAIHH